MATKNSTERLVFQIHILTNEPKFPSIRDVTAFLYDLNLLYEILRLAIDPNYEGFQFSSNVGRRNGRNRLEKRDQLHIQSLRIESPLHLVAFLAALQPQVTVPCIAALVAAIEVIYLIKAKNRLLNAQAQELEDKHLRAPDVARIVKAQAEKIERENRQATLKQFDDLLSASAQDSERVLQHLENRGALGFYSNASKRLRKSVVQIVSIEVDFIDLGPSEK